MQRWVIHVDMDAFFASCEQLTRPTLRGRPVLVGGASGRGVVAGASYEARTFGARSAMPMYQAKALIGMRGVVVSPRFAVYRAASQRVFSILERMGGTVEKISIDEGFVEPPELYGASASEVDTWAQRLRAVIRDETGLSASVGGGAGKQVAKICSDLAKPDGIYLCAASEHEEKMYPLPVGRLWGVGPVTRTKLQQLGVETIGDLACMSEREIDISLGTTVGRSLWRLAQGHDDREVAPRAIAKQISVEHTYPKDLVTSRAVDTAIIRASRESHRRLLDDGRGARTVSVKLRMADFRIESRSATLPYATDNLDTVTATALKLARYPDEVGPIRLVGVGLSGLEDARQDILFPELDRVVPVKDTDFEVGVSDPHDSDLEISTTDESPTAIGWRATQDIWHPDYGHGWVQGLGHGKITVRFETRTTGPGKVRTFDTNDALLSSADPINSLDWS
ncbi:DNA polymerase IV [Corynebacterium diphtheriae]|uniref:DNA polymerase IV n=1 Tax=Corynebacterium diphtheriae TaxID=1717 RepID=UPI000B4B0A3A|nr:DNA polymerase IV [Corynebacterium diphtheriae]OWN40834.1 DNA polymerase IV [Corynebacterium diphtheriae bv. gravis]OWN68293.1 DNA polymerase IV [Corynebacterium diphtheriae bv. gravis]OWO23671.1 DNA polymerase IV [Corynebacterium diphtheriae bv. gravis]OWO52196.1 DNA polymerase IV [Corynebacterium diphtheriae bv. gravis]CAB0513619.1 DNA polymerase IV [Corynebacterium diphtheriae]